MQIFWFYTKKTVSSVDLPFSGFTNRPTNKTVSSVDLSFSGFTRTNKTVSSVDLPFSDFTHQNKTVSSVYTCKQNCSIADFQIFTNCATFPYSGLTQVYW